MGNIVFIQCCLQVRGFVNSGAPNNVLSIQGRSKSVFDLKSRAPNNFFSSQGRSKAVFVLKVGRQTMFSLVRGVVNRVLTLK